MPLYVNVHLNDGSTQGLDRKQAFIKVDEALCAALGIEPDPVEWYRHWADFIPLIMASDKFDFAEVSVEELGEENYRVLEWFVNNTTVTGHYHHA